MGSNIIFYDNEAVGENIKCGKGEGDENFREGNFIHPCIPHISRAPSLFVKCAPVRVGHGLVHPKVSMPKHFDELRPGI